jgi:pimeloyl-ACP methyl ester carboxylesterase
VQSGSGHQRVNGLKLYVHRFRDPAAAPSGLTVLLVHGFLDAGGSWDLVAPQLAREGHEVIAPDLRGFGQSDAIGPGGYYHFADYVADLTELCDVLAPRRLAVVGHSMGGTISGLLAGARPTLPERLALLEGMGPPATEPAVAVDRMRAWLRDMREAPRGPRLLSSMEEAVQRLALHHPRVPREVIQSRAPLLTKLDEQGRLVWAYDSLHRTTSPTPFHAEAFKAFLSKIECPTLVVSGGPAGYHAADEGERIACIRGARVVELPTAGHMMHWTAPDALAQQLLAFLAEPLPPKPAPDTLAPGSKRVG